MRPDALLPLFRALIADRYALLGATIMLLVAGLCVLFFGLPYSESAYATGEREGRVTVFERVGWPQSWEGELQRYSADEPWAFSVAESRTDVVEALTLAEAVGAVVRVKYRQVWLNDPTRYGSDKRIEGVKLVSVNVWVWTMDMAKAGLVEPLPPEPEKKRRWKWRWPWTRK